jgi:hypothetical protein
VFFKNLNLHISYGILGVQWQNFYFNIFADYCPSVMQGTYRSCWVGKSRLRSCIGLQIWKPWSQIICDFLKKKFCSWILLVANMPNMYLNKDISWVST